MKQGRTIVELAQEVNRQTKMKRDFLIDTRHLRMKDHVNNQHQLLTFNHDQHQESMRINDICHGQISARLNIPKKYYDKMQVDSPELLSVNVNHWFDKNHEVRMIRTLDEVSRAFLSSRYRAFDNYDLLEVVLPVIQNKECSIVSTEVTSNRLYLKVLFPKLEGEIKVGDTVQGGLVISNSEVGLGSLRVEPLIYRLVCLNGMITNTAMRKYHVGRGLDQIDNIQEVLSDRTRQVTDTAFWMQVRDVVKSSMNQVIFDDHINKLKKSTEKKITGDPVKVVEVVKKIFGLGENQGSSIIQNLIKGNDLSQWGLANAVTATANDEEIYEEATNLERFGGKIIELNHMDWKVIAETV